MLDCSRQNFLALARCCVSQFPLLSVNETMNVQQKEARWQAFLLKMRLLNNIA